MARSPTTQIEALQLIIEETRTQGPPTLTRLRSLMDGKQVRNSVLGLIARGKVSQAYDDGPLIPLETWEGEPLVLRLESRTRLDQINAFAQGYLDELPAQEFAKYGVPSERQDVMHKLKAHIESQASEKMCG